MDKLDPNRDHFISMEEFVNATVEPDATTDEDAEIILAKVRKREYKKKKEREAERLAAQARRRQNGEAESAPRNARTDEAEGSGYYDDEGEWVEEDQRSRPAARHGESDTAMHLLEQKQVSEKPKPPEAPEAPNRPNRPNRREPPAITRITLGARA